MKLKVNLNSSRYNLVVPGMIAILWFVLAFLFISIFMNSLELLKMMAVVYGVLWIVSAILLTLAYRVRWELDRRRIRAWGVSFLCEVLISMPVLFLTFDKLF